MLTLIFPTQGNPIAALRTIKSVSHIVDEIVIGSVCLFEEDVEMLHSYKKDFNIKIIGLPFNYIFLNGFSKTLNHISSFAKNDLILYLNVGETIEKSEGDISSKFSPDFNSYYIDHSQENHRWWRCYNRRDLKWDGLIHEELWPDENFKPYNKPLFTFADTEKDMLDPFKAKVKNDVKECVYWRQLMQLVDHPELLSSTNAGWLKFAHDTYQSMSDRIKLKGNRFKYFIEGDYDALMKDYYTNPEFEKERFDSNHAIEFQGSPMYLGKK